MIAHSFTLLALTLASRSFAFDYVVVGGGAGYVLFFCCIYTVL